MFGLHRALGSLHRPVLALAFQLSDRGMVEQLPAQPDSGIGQTAGVGHRVQGTRTPVQQGGGDLFGTGGLLACCTGQQLHRGAATLPLFFTTAQIRLATGVVRHVQGALAAQLAVDAVFVDQAEHQGRCRAEHAIELAAHRRAKTGLDLVRRNPHPGIHQAYVAPRTTVAGAVGFEDGDAFTLFQQVNGCRQTGDTGTDHADIHVDLALERSTIRPARGELFPQTCFA